MGYSATQSEIERFENVDSDFLRMKRRENAVILINALSERLTLPYTVIQEEDCPLHVPVLIPESERSHIRKKLIENGIYCPCHWPIDEKYPYQKTTYHVEELSLICDQRYTKELIAEEARKIIDIIEIAER